MWVPSVSVTLLTWLIARIFTPYVLTNRDLNMAGRRLVLGGWGVFLVENSNIFYGVAIP